MAPNNTLPIWGNEKTMNMNHLILTNIQSSPYFKVNLYELKTYHEVIDEIYYKVSHLEPWEKGSRKTAGQTGMCGGVRGVGAGGIVSSAYCLLYKLFTLRLTRKQLQGLLDHADSPYIRGLGFMYIRYSQDPKYFWEWYEPYLDDDEEVDVKAGGGHVITIGEMCRQWLVKLEWYSTLFPRIPVPVQKDLDVKMRARNAEKLQQIQEEAPRHIGDDEVNFGEAEKYATTAATRRRSPTPPYRSRPRSPPPRRRTPPPPRHRSPPHRSQPRHRVSPHRHRRSRSPRRGGSPMDFATELQREKERQERHNEDRDNRDQRSRSRDRKHLKHKEHERKRTEEDDDDDPINFAKNLLRQKELQEKQIRDREKKSHSDERRKAKMNEQKRAEDDEDEDDDPINFAKQLLREKKRQEKMIREHQTQHEKKSHSKDLTESTSHVKRHKKESKEHKRKRSRSKDRERKRSRSQERSAKRRSRSREKASGKHRSRSRSREKKKSKERKRSRSIDKNGHR